nr:uncharacterized protein LOC127340057 [Lolium perenne]
MGVDLEQPAYHAIPADPHHDQPPILGNAPPPATCKEEWAFPIAILVSLVLMVVMIGPVEYLVQTNMPAFSVALAGGYHGIVVARPASVVSPAFNLTLRMTKACADRAEVVLTYSGVALGWARVEPRGCVSREPWGRDVEVVARADGVGLSRRLRERMAAEWRRSGRVELDADVAVYNDRGTLGYFGDYASDKVMRSKVVVMADGLRLEPESCPCQGYIDYNDREKRLRIPVRDRKPELIPSSDELLLWTNNLQPFGLGTYLCQDTLSCYGK